MEPTQLSNRFKKEIDSKCELILNIMTLRRLYEPDKIRYNELFREVKKLSGKKAMSKPTFNEHLNHLIEKKLISRKVVGKQEVYVYLNLKNSKIVRLRDMQKQISKEVAALNKQMENPNFWAKVPTLMSRYFALCELRRTKAIFEFLLTPAKAKENIIALMYQAKTQDIIEDHMVVRLANAILEFNDQTKREEMKNKIVESLNNAILKIQNDLIGDKL